MLYTSDLQILGNCCYRAGGRLFIVKPVTELCKLKV